MELTVEQIHEIVWQAAGVGSGAVMRRAPDVVMPEADINAGLNMLMEEFGIPQREVN